MGASGLKRNGRAFSSYRKGKGAARQYRRPPPASTLASSELVACAHRQARPGVNGIEQLRFVASVRAVSLVREVQTLEKHAQVVVDVIAGAEVHERGGVHERRLRAEVPGVLLLAETRQIRVLPVDGDSGVEAPLLEERHEVSRIRQPRNGEVADQGVGGIVGLAGIHEG